MDRHTEREELERQIRDAFPDEAFCEPVTNCKCEECSSMSKELRYKKWGDVPPAFLDFTCSPTLLTAAAFQAFLPAYMLRAINDFAGDSNVLEFTVYSLSPALSDEDTFEQNSPKLMERAALMTAEQIHSVRSFLWFASQDDGLKRFAEAALHTAWLATPRP